MLKICSSAIALAIFLTVGMPCHGSPPPLRDLLTQWGATESDILNLDKSAPFSGCFRTPAYVICAERKWYANLDKNPQARSAILRGMSIEVRNMLYRHMINLADGGSLKNREAVSKTYIDDVESGKTAYLLKHVEFFSLFDKGSCYAVASVPTGSSVPVIEAKLRAPFFTNDYCEHLYPEARKLMDQGAYNDALAILKELHDLKFASVPAYLLAAHGLMKTGQFSDARKIANELWRNFTEKMDAVQLEDLGDIFSDLDDAGMAEKAYGLALRKVMN